MKKIVFKTIDKLEENKITYKSLCQDVYKIVMVVLVMVSIGDKVNGVEEHEVKAAKQGIESTLLSIDKEYNVVGESLNKEVVVTGSVVSKEDLKPEERELLEKSEKEYKEKVEKEEELELEEKIYILSEGEEVLEPEQYGFIKMIIPQVIELAEENGIYPSIMVAQAILESDWGQSELAVEANNLFGIKGSYEGSSYNKSTLEDDGAGNKYEIVGKFAKYPSTRESLESNVKLLAEGLTYDENFYEGTWVVNASNYKESANSLTGTYATDIEYSRKLIEIIERYSLYELD